MAEGLNSFLNLPKNVWKCKQNNVCVLNFTKVISMRVHWMYMEFVMALVRLITVFWATLQRHHKTKGILSPKFVEKNWYRSIFLWLFLRITKIDTESAYTSFSFTTNDRSQHKNMPLKISNAWVLCNQHSLLQPRMLLAFVHLPRHVLLVDSYAKSLLKVYRV